LVDDRRLLLSRQTIFKRYNTQDTHIIYNLAVEFAAELQASLQEFVSSGVVEVRENDGRVAPFSGMSWEVRGAGEKPLLHLWSDQFKLTRRVLAITDHSEDQLALTVSPDLEHSLSGNYARGLLRRGSTYAALLAVPDGESSETADNSLTFALLWLLRARQSNPSGAITTLRIILPKDTSPTVAHRLAALHSQCRVDLYDRNPALALDRALPALKEIIALAPLAITQHPVAQSREVWLRFRGLPFARWDDGRIFFGIGDAREELASVSRAALKRRLHDLEAHRHPLAADTRHSRYRAQPERWLESIVREVVTRVDAALDQRFVYAQVFANAGGEHGILDLLTVTRTGRLAIIELKASEHIHLPLQAADYWLRVRRHLQSGEITR
jgi:hypothetical protein